MGLEASNPHSRQELKRQVSCVIERTTCNAPFPDAFAPGGPLDRRKCGRRGLYGISRSELQVALFPLTQGFEERRTGGNRHDPAARADSGGPGEGALPGTRATQ